MFALIQILELEILVVGISFLCFALLYTLYVVQGRNDYVLLNGCESANKTTRVSHSLNRLNTAILLHKVDIMQLLAYTCFFPMFEHVACFFSVAFMAANVLPRIVVLTGAICDQIRDIWKLKHTNVNQFSPFCGVHFVYGECSGYYVG